MVIKGNDGVKICRETVIYITTQMREARKMHTLCILGKCMITVNVCARINRDIKLITNM